MSNVINFPPAEEMALDELRDELRTELAEAGLTPTEIPLALERIEPNLKNWRPRKVYTIEIPSELGLDGEQTDAMIKIFEAHLKEQNTYTALKDWHHLQAMAWLVAQMIRENR